MIAAYTPLNNYRYERKFVCNTSHKGQLNIIVRQNKAAFRRAYPGRQINNIYFDTPGLDCYFDNLFGIGKRWKARIRWYGDLFQDILNPVLEIKIKQGLVGTKQSWVLKSISFAADFSDIKIIRNTIAASDLPEDVRSKMLGMQPVLVNNYQREYFVSADKNFRLTLDSDLTFRDFRMFRKTTRQVYKERGKLVVELKYAQEFDEEAGTISNSFPFRLNKNSKFVSGMMFIRPGVAE